MGDHLDSVAEVELLPTHVLQASWSDFPCILWQGRINRNGYGYVQVGKARTKVMAHRLMWEAFVGPIGAGKQLDHLCRNRGCIQVQHLEPVSNQENTLRAVAAKRKHAPKTTNFLESSSTAKVLWRMQRRERQL